MDHMAELREYLDAQGSSPYAKWFDRLNAAAAVKVVTAVHRMEQGNFSSVKSVGAGVYEYRIDFGSGYWIYFGKRMGSAGDIARGWYQKAPGWGYYRRKSALARL